MPIYISFDIEADGPTPLDNNMISFGCVAYSKNGSLIDTFMRNIKNIEGHVSDPNTMKFWNLNKEAYKFTQENKVSPEQFVEDLSNFLKKNADEDNKIKWIARPASFDWMFLKCYYERFKKTDYFNLGYSSLCITSMYKQYIKDNKLSKEQDNELWSKLTKDHKLDHNPVNDAKYQAAIYFGINEITQ